MQAPALAHPTRLPLRAPQGREVDVWLIRYSADDFDPADFEASGIPRPPAICRSVPHRQAEYLHGRRAARHALQILGVPVHNVPTGAHRQPIWPAGVVGSITHSRSLAAAVAARLGPLQAIGIDVEGVAEGSSLQALLEVAIDDAELALLRQIAPALELAALVTLVFSAKESFFKAAYAEVGRYFDFTAVKVTAVDVGHGHLTLELREPLSAVLVPGVVRHASFAFLAEEILFTACLW